MLCVGNCIILEMPNISMFTWKLSEFINVHSLFKLIRFRPLSQLTLKAAPLTWGPHPGGRIPAIEPLLQRRGLMSVKTPHYSTRHLQLWQQQFVWWWKTPTLTLQRTPQHQRNQQWTLPNNGQTCPHCVWMTRLWNWTRLPQVHNHSHADIHSQFNVLPEFFFFFFLKRYHWYRWGDTSSPTSANPWVLRTGCGCRLVYCQSKRRQLPCLYDSCHVITYPGLLRPNVHVIQQCCNNPPLLVQPSQVRPSKNARDSPAIWHIIQMIKVISHVWIKFKGLQWIHAVDASSHYCGYIYCSSRHSVLMDFIM